MRRFPLLLGAASIAVAAGAVIATAHETDGRRGGGPATMLLEHFDRDGDGTVTRAEVEQEQAARFAEADTDGDGQISLDEMVAAQEAQRLARQTARAERMLERLDEDGNGMLSPEEAAAAHQRHARLFDVIDADDDGEITAEELEEIMQARRGGWGHRMGFGSHGGGGWGRGHH